MAAPRWLCAGAACVLVALVTLDGVAARQVGPATERPSGPTVDFIAVDADGTPVPDLQSSEVEVRINDRVRTLRALRRVIAAPGRSSGPGGLPSPYGTNDFVAAGRSFALVVDQESFVGGHEQLLRNAVQGLLEAVTPADQVLVAALPFGGVVLPFSSDVGRIRAAVEATSAQGSRTETGSEMACRTRRFLESLDGFLRAHTGGRSPMTLIVFTAGLAGPRRDAPIAMAPGMCELPVDSFQRLTGSAGAARANVYVMQPADIAMAATGWSESIAGGNYLGSDNPLEGIEHLAGVTGGARLPLDASGTAALRRVAAETAVYYEAELEPVRGAVFGRSASLTVRVARRGVIVRARPQITLVESESRPAGTRLAVPELLASTAPFADLPLRIGGFTLRDADGGLRLGVVVEAANPGSALASVGAILTDTSGRVLGRWFATDAAERPLLGAMAAGRGTYRLRVAAIDTAGRAGAAEEIVEVGLTPIGPLTLGSLMLGVSRPEGMRMQLEFSAEPTAIASFDIYGGTAGLRIGAWVEVARERTGPALTTGRLALSRAADDRVIATGAVPVGALPPGDYVVRGIIRLEDGTTGTVMRTLRKVAR